MLRYGLTIFLSAMLLFQVQPLVARVILPWFGGTAAVWSACMLFFQTGLLIGYAYAHALRRWLNPVHGWCVHLLLLVVAAIFANPVPAESLQPAGEESLVAGVWSILLWTIGLPYVALSSTSPLIQAWQSETNPHRSPYPLYALSNVGSLLALISFPLVVEPTLSTHYQGLVWQFGFWLFAILSAISGFQLRGKTSWASSEQDRLISNDNPNERFRTGPWQSLAWLGLSMTGSVVLLATTNLLCQEIASVPLLWVGPLTIYLLSFILCFDYPWVYQRWLFVPLLSVSSIIAVLVVLINVFAGVAVQIGALLTVCFAATMTCHGELERLKPAARDLTRFYLMLALGGAIGGVLVAILAPNFFDGFYEFHLGLLVSLLILLVAVYAGASRSNRRTSRGGLGTLGLWSGILMLMSSIAIVSTSLYFMADPRMKPDQIYRERNEYGILAIEEKDGYRKFIHGRIEHGGESVSETGENFGSYYRPGSGVGIAFESVRKKFLERTDGDRNPKGLKVGVVGLGIGGMLAWSELADSFDFFELDPAVEKIAKEYFGYFKRSSATTDVIIGDGRIQLKRRANRIEQIKGGHRPGHRYDLLFLDAFSSDSIPIHLMTEECFAIYLKNIEQDGVLIVHITNRFVDLRPVVYHHATKKEMNAVLIETPKSDSSPQTRWVLMTRDQALYELMQAHPNKVDWPEDMKPVRWTDDRSSLFDVLRWSETIDWEPIVDSSQRARKRVEQDSKN